MGSELPPPKTRSTCSAKLAQVGCLWVSLSLHLQIHVRPALASDRHTTLPLLSVLSLTKYSLFFHFHSLGLDQFHNYFNAILPVWRMETRQFVTFFFPVRFAFRWLCFLG